MLILKPLRKMQKIDLKNITRPLFGGESHRVHMGNPIKLLKSLYPEVPIMQSRKARAY